MLLSKIAALQDDLVNVIIETPRGSSYKYTYDPESDTFELSKTLPAGASFPFDFGFIPNTLAEDGDPLDVLVIMEEPAYPGSRITCRLLGVLEALQKERDGKEMRNDRFVAVPDRSLLYAEIKQLADLNKNIEPQIADFFKHYNEQAGKVFTPLRWLDAASALQLVKKSVQK